MEGPSEKAWNELRQERLSGLLRAAQNGLVVFAGAGVSIAEPASCPSWDGLKRQILTALSERITAMPSTVAFIEPPLEDVCPYLRPESFMLYLIHALGRDVAVNLLAGLNGRSPNPNHRSIAALVRAGIVHTIVTTNFENYLESALRQSGIEFVVVRDDAEVLQAMPLGNRVVVFKPHGCLSKPESLQFTLNEIQRLSAEKSALLEQLIRDKALLILGYSGNDEDFFPVLKECIHANRTGTWAIVHPQATASEPIAALDLADNERLRLVIARTEEVLGHLVRELVGFGMDVSPLLGSSSPRSERTWSEVVDDTLRKVSPFAAAVTAALLLSAGGNHRASLAYASAARRIGAMFRGDELLIRSLLEVEAYGHKELGEFAPASEGSYKNMAVDFVGAGKVLPHALLEHIHILLRQWDVSGADRLLHSLSVSDLSAKDLTIYLWYKGILLRKQGRNAEAESWLCDALERANDSDDLWHAGRILLDLANVYEQKREYSRALEVLTQAIDKAERATDWSTCAKATKNRGHLLSLSDSPHLGPPDLHRAIALFEKAGDIDGVERTRRLLSASKAELLQMLFTTVWVKRKDT